MHAHVADLPYFYLALKDQTPPTFLIPIIGIVVTALQSHVQPTYLAFVLIKHLTVKI